MQGVLRYFTHLLGRPQNDPVFIVKREGIIFNRIDISIVSQFGIQFGVIVVRRVVTDAGGGAEAACF
jgi:hypothetical protein